MKSNFRTASEDIAGKIFSAMASMEELILVVPVAVLLIVYSVEALPFPAPNLQNCLTSEECCTPVLFDGEARKFQFQAHLQLRVRPAAHLVDDAYVAKYQRATERMRALPDTDGRSFHNQYKLHCAYCDNHLYFAGSVQQYPLEIHGSWLFFPWHRLYLYFYERILAKLIDDDAFALPFWNWDNQSPTSPLANVVPRLYAEETSSINKTSSLYDPDRTDCAKRPGGFVNFQDFSTCPVGHANASLIRATNAHIVYVNMVAGGVTPLAFHGRPYRLGDQGGGGPGSIEGTPHGPVHSWVNTKQATFKDSASDPIFFAHHANVDRLWNLWKTLPGGARHDISDPDYLNTLFTFYNEDGALVTASVAQALQIDQLRYKYQEVPNPWLSEGADREDSKRESNKCNTKSSSEIADMVETTELFQGPLSFSLGPVTFKLRRHANASSEHGEEMMELRGEIDYAEFFLMTAFAFHPDAQLETSLGCAELLGVNGHSPHIGMSQNMPPDRVWRVGIRRQLELIGMDHLDYIVVTLTGSELNQKGIVLTSANVIYSKE